MSRRHFNRIATDIVKRKALERMPWTTGKMIFYVYNVIDIRIDFFFLQNIDIV